MEAAGHRMTIRRLAGTALVVGGWSFLPVFSGPPLGTTASVEFVDHVVPGTVALLGAIVLFAVRERAAAEGAIAELVAPGLTFLAGVWMVSTHVPLLNQARRGEAPWAGSLYHSAAAFLVLGVGVAWASSAWSQAE